MRLKPSPLTLSSAVALGALLAALLAPAAWWLRLPLGLPLVLLLPGYGVVSSIAAFDPLGRMERIAMAIGLSLSLTIGLGFLLHATLGLGDVSWVAALGALTVGADIAAGLRRPRVARPPLPVPPRALIIGTAVAVAAAVLLSASSRDSMKPSGEEIVQLWALRTPRAGSRDVEIGVANRISTGTRFRLHVSHAGVVVTDTLLAIPDGGSTSVIVRAPESTDTATPMRAVLTEVGRGSERMVAIWPSEPPKPDENAR